MAGVVPPIRNVPVPVSGRSGDGPFEQPESFRVLLERLAEAHDREVIELRLENDRLRRPLEANLQGRRIVPRFSDSGSGGTSSTQVPTPHKSGVKAAQALLFADGHGAKPQRTGPIDVDSLIDAIGVADIEAGVSDEELMDVSELDEFESTPRTLLQVAPSRASGADTRVPQERSVVKRVPVWAKGTVQLESRNSPRFSEEGHDSTYSDMLLRGATDFSEEQVRVSYNGGAMQLGNKSPLDRWRGLTRYAQAKILTPEAKLHTVADMWTSVRDGPRVNRPIGRTDGSVGQGIARGLQMGALKPPNPTWSNLHQLTSGSRRVWEGLRAMAPTSSKRMTWDFLGLVLLSHDLIMIPMQVFDSGTQGMPAGYDDFVSVFDVISAVFWSIDICVSFLTGHYTSEGFLELRPFMVARHYTRSWFLLDAAIVTTDWTTIAIGMGKSSGFLRLGKTASRVMRVLRLLRFMKLNTSLREMIERINSEYLLTLAGLVKLVIYIVLVNHYIACAWYWLSQITDDDRNWAKKFLNDTDTMSYAYATSLHWSLTQFTPASMEVVPQNSWERFFNSFVIIMAMVTFSSFVSSITSAMTHIRNINARQVEQQSRIRQYFHQNKISHELASRVWHWLRMNHNLAGRMMKEEDVPVLAMLPQRIRDQLRMEVFMPMLNVHPIFHVYATVDPESMCQVCRQAVYMKTMLPGQELFANSREMVQMFFVANGVMIYFRKDEDPMQHKQVRRGGWACELALWARRPSLDGPFVAGQAGGELVLINPTEFHAVVRYNVETFFFLKTYAKMFIDAFNDATLDPSYDNVLFDSYDTVSVMAVKALERVGYNVTRATIYNPQPRFGKEVILRALFEQRVASAGSLGSPFNNRRSTQSAGVSEPGSPIPSR